MKKLMTLVLACLYGRGARAEQAGKREKKITKAMLGWHAAVLLKSVIMTAVPVALAVFCGGDLLPGVTIVAALVAYILPFIMLAARHKNEWDKGKPKTALYTLNMSSTAIMVYAAIQVWQGASWVVVPTIGAVLASTYLLVVRSDMRHILGLNTVEEEAVPQLVEEGVLGSPRDRPARASRPSMDDLRAVADLPDGDERSLTLDPAFVEAVVRYYQLLAERRDKEPACQAVAIVALGSKIVAVLDSIGRYSVFFDPFYWGYKEPENWAHNPPIPFMLWDMEVAEMVVSSDPKDPFRQVRGIGDVLLYAQAHVEPLEEDTVGWYEELVRVHVQEVAA